MKKFKAQGISLLYIHTTSYENVITCILHFYELKPLSVNFMSIQNNTYYVQTKKWFILTFE